MYNLLVRRYVPNDSWDDSNVFTLERERIFEYTNERISSKYREDLQSLKDLPCLFSYEEFKGTGRVGRIDAVTENGPSVDVVYRLYTCFPAIPIYSKQTYRLFGCHDVRECYRTHWAVKDGDLFDIVDELEREGRAYTGVEVSDEVMNRIWGPKSRTHYRVFLSHSARDKSRTAEIAGELKELGHRTFVAHDDIQATREWRDEIVHALNTMTHFVGLVTDDFHSRVWTDQEVGYAFCREDVKRIFVMLSEVNPEGLALFEQAITPAEPNVAQHIHNVMIENQ